MEATTVKWDAYQAPDQRPGTLKDKQSADIADRAGMLQLELQDM